MDSGLKKAMVLVAMGFAAALFSIPYVFALLGPVLTEAMARLNLSESAFRVLIVVQTTVVYGLAAAIGVALYKKAGFRMPVLERVIDHDPVHVDWIRLAGVSIGVGAAVGIVIIVGDRVFAGLGSPLSLVGQELPAWRKGLLGSFTAAAGEFRLLIVSSLALILRKRLEVHRSVWVAIVLAALAFGLMHLRATAALVGLTPIVAIRAILLNGIGATAFGLLYWTQGLESAMLAHFTADVFIHVVAVLFF